MSQNWYQLMKLAGTGNNFNLREDLSEDRLEQSNPDYNPYATHRSRKGPGNQLGDISNDGPHDGGDYEDENWKDWMKKIDDLAERQNPITAPSDAGMMDTADPEVVTDGTAGQQHNFAGGLAETVKRKVNPQGDPDNSNREKRLPGYGIPIAPVIRNRDRRASTDVSQAKSFNTNRQKQDVSPLEIAWAFQKGRVG